MKIVDLGERQRQKRQAAELNRLEDMAQHKKP